MTATLPEDARLRPIRLRTIRLRPAGRNRNGRSRNWPKSKLIGRNRTDGVCSVSSTSLFILFLCCFCPKKPELNTKPRTLHPISDGPFRWTPPSGESPPPPDNPPPDNPPPDRPNFRSFFSLLPPQFSFFFLSLGVLAWNFGVKRRGPEMCTFGVLGLSCASPGGPVWWGRRTKAKVRRMVLRGVNQGRSRGIDAQCGGSGYPESVHQCESHCGGQVGTAFGRR